MNRLPPTSAKLPSARSFEDGWRALHDGDFDEAARIFSDALVSGGTAEAHEGLARVRYLERDYQSAVDHWSAAYGLYRRDREDVAASRVAGTLAHAYGMVFRDGAVMSGWLGRVTSLGGGEGGSGDGRVPLIRAMFEADRTAKEDLCREAVDLARQSGDTDVEFEALAYLGASMVHGDRIEDGMHLLDEALAAVAGHDVDDFLALSNIFCQLFAACEYAHDVDRADQWIRVGEQFAERRRIPSVAAFCHTHYGGLLIASGRWAEAESALTEAAQSWGEIGYMSLRDDALARLAELRVRQDRVEEAQELLRGLDVGVDTARPFAAVHIAQGRDELAVDVLEQVLDGLDPLSLAAAPMWAMLVDAHLEGERLHDATKSAEMLDACAQRHDRDYVRALSALARGRICLAAPTGDACAALREAISGFSRARTPMELGQTRLALASALAPERPEVAIAEARRALEEFERLAATRHADAAAALLRSLGVRERRGGGSAGELTRREREVLDLVGHGLSNPEIADRLYISRKTVEHHVGNVLAKLGLRSRSEAAAHVARARARRDG